MIEFENVSLDYPNGAEALKNINLAIQEGEFVVIVGMSGAGKSTLMKCINRMAVPSEGIVFVGGVAVNTLKETQLRKLRTGIGIIFQDFNLVRRLSVLRNVIVGRLGHTSTFKSIIGRFPQKDLQLAMNNLERMGIKDKAYTRADQLSGGQQQRVSIARVLTQQPRIILADEPVASLDPPTSHQVMRDLKKVSKEDRLTTVVNLHYIDLAMEYADRIIGMREGKIVFDGPIEEVDETTFEEIYGRPIRLEEQKGE